MIDIHTQNNVKKLNNRWLPYGENLFVCLFIFTALFALDCEGLLDICVIEIYTF
jgi:hypothetical protein